MRNSNLLFFCLPRVPALRVLPAFCVLVASMALGGELNHEDRALGLLKALVEVNSHSSNLVGVSKVRVILVKEFKKLGFQSRSFEVGEGHQVLSFDFVHGGRAKSEAPTLALVGHLDTVFPPSAFSKKFKVEGSKIYGPGIIDMKGGLVVLLEVLRGLTPNERSKIRVLLNDDEELASVHSRTKLKELAQGIPFGLVFEPGLPGGAVVTSSVGGQWIKVTVRGKAAHAGLEHEKGLNACVELAHKLVALHALTDYSKKVTVNVGVLQGGTQPNVVCQEASVVLDIRYVDPADFEKVLNRVREVAEKSVLHNSILDLSPTVELETLTNVPSLPPRFTARLFDILNKSSVEIQQPIQGVHVGYGTDANHLSETGMELLVGLGPFGGGMHTADEFLQIDSLRSRTLLGQHLVREILRLKVQP